MAARTSSRLLLVALTLAGGLAACGERAPRGERIVLITLDTLRYDSLLGEPTTMPQLAATAAEGVVFDQFYAATSSTQPSHASMFTGLHPWQHGVTRNGKVLDDVAETLAERLAAAGWSTAAVVASFPLQRRFGFAQGFDTFDDAFDQALDSKDAWNDEEVEDSLFFSRADAITAAALGQLDAASGDKQFFWFHYFDPHAPYGDSGDELIELRDLNIAARSREPGRIERVLARARQLYDRDVTAMDSSLGELLQRLAVDAKRWRTHILITADHGESFGEDGSMAHGKRVSRVQVHVPTVLLSPGVAAARRSDPAGSVDVLPTLLALAGLDTDDAGFGRDLLAPGPGAGAFGMRRSFAEPGKDLRTDGEVVPVSGPRFFLVHAGLLYIGNSEVVTCEQADVPPEQLEAARRLFTNFAFELQNQGAIELLDDETQAAMEALGYLR